MVDFPFAMWVFGKCKRLTSPGVFQDYLKALLMLPAVIQAEKQEVDGSQPLVLSISFEGSIPSFGIFCK